MAIDLTKKVSSAASNVNKAVNTVNTFSDLSPQVGQLKTNLSISQKSQLDALSGVTGISGSANRIAGNLTNALAGVDNTTASIISVSSNLSSALEGAGMTSSTAKSLITQKVSSAIVNKTPLDKASSATPTDLGQLANRLPKAKKNPGKEIKRSIERLVGFRDGNYAGYSFPSDLGGSTAKSWIKIRLLEYTRGNPFAPGSISETNLIQLPLPKSLMEMFSVNYDAKDYGVATGAVVNAGAKDGSLQKVADLVQSARRGQASNEQAQEAVTQLGSSITNTASNQGQDIAFSKLQDLTTSALSSTGQEGIAGLADQLAGGVPNPHSTVFFKGVNLRTFTWNWYLVPRSASEANSLRIIVSALKMATLPDLDGSILRYPLIVEPSIGGLNAIDMKFKRCMIGDLGIEYTPDAQAFHSDGAPVALNLSITFKETEIFTQQDL